MNLGTNKGLQDYFRKYIEKEEKRDEDTIKKIQSNNSK